MHYSLIEGDSGDDSSVGDLHGLAGDENVVPLFAPLIAFVALLCETNFIKIEDPTISINRVLNLVPHGHYLVVVSTVVALFGHVGHVDGLFLDHVVLVHLS